MSGGGWEYMMGVYNNDVKSSGFTNLPNSKYYHNYSTTLATTACSNGICYGHALSETSGWYYDLAYMINADVPWIACGGMYSYIEIPEDAGGIFSFARQTGAAFDFLTFRTVLLD